VNQLDSESITQRFNQR